ncbi:MAG: glycyl-radical enzyme activating protein [Cloacibacillus sp.]
MVATGQVLRIERSSSYDGEGLRTVIFLKGCPMSCIWCSTPESQKIVNEIGCDDVKCLRCGLCVSLCPNRALSKSAQGVPKMADGKCNGCGECAKNCPTNAISLYGKSMTADEVVAEIAKDELLYFHSGGGFTFSGGEALTQPKFVAEVFKLAMQRGISGTIETSACVPWENIAAVVPLVPKFYVDIKHMDPVRHKELTGLSNEIVLDNIRKIDGCGCDITIRVPVIPTINDGEDNIKATADFCRGLKNISELELLAYHKLGMITYRKLGRKMELNHMEPPSKNDMLQIARRLKLTLPSLSVKINGGEI